MCVETLLMVISTYLDRLTRMPVGTGTHCYLLFRHMKTESQGSVMQSGTAMSRKV